MAYHLGIDLGTTYSSAAIAAQGRLEVVPLGHRTVLVPSVAYLGESGFLFGEAAERRAVTDPSRVTRHFKRRVGDDTPFLIGTTAVTAELLLGRLGRWIVDETIASERHRPSSLTITHPATWGTYRVELLRQAIVEAGVEAVVPGGGVRYETEPVAASVFYASQRPLAEGAVVAVYDLGGGTFDAAVVRRGAGGFDILGRPAGIADIGGIDFDQLVFDHVLAAIGVRAGELAADDPATVAAIAQLREQCVSAKEALSVDSDVSIPVLLPQRQTEVRLTRSEFEQMIRPSVDATIDALQRTLSSSGVVAREVAAVLLVGGSSRIPLVGQRIATELGLPVALDARPKDVIALGAALSGWHASLPGEPVPAGLGTAHPSPPPPPVPDRRAVHPPPTPPGTAPDPVLPPPAPAPAPAPASSDAVARWPGRRFGWLVVSGIFTAGISTLVLGLLYIRTPARRDQARVLLVVTVVVWILAALGSDYDPDETTERSQGSVQIEP